MDRKITIKDIAEAADVSISSVHLALNGKSGVSEATRARIKAVADALGYTPNVLASNLKRETRTVAVLLPMHDASSRHYFDYMWQALNDYAPTANEYHLRLQGFPCDGEHSVFEHFDLSKCSGIVSVGVAEYLHPYDLEVLRKSNLPIVLVDGELPNFNCLCSVQCSADSAGKLTAELLLNCMHSTTGKIVILGVGPSAKNRRSTEQVIAQALSEAGQEKRILILDYDKFGDACYSAVKKALSSGVIAGACAVNSRSTLVFGECIEATGKVGYFPVIGNGLFPKAKEQLKDGIVTALVHKHPYRQCLEALRVMTDYLAKSIVPQKSVVSVNVDAVFRSVVDQYNEKAFQ